MSRGGGSEPATAYICLCAATVKPPPLTEDLSGDILGIVGEHSFAADMGKDMADWRAAERTRNC